MKTFIDILTNEINIIILEFCTIDDSVSLLSLTKCTYLSEKLHKSIYNQMPFYNIMYIYDTILPEDDVSNNFTQIMEKYDTYQNNTLCNDLYKFLFVGNKYFDSSRIHENINYCRNMIAIDLFWYFLKQNDIGVVKYNMLSNLNGLSKRKYNKKFMQKEMNRFMMYDVNMNNMMLFRIIRYNYDMTFQEKVYIPYEVMVKHLSYCNIKLR
jgi:hypothetical protein